MNPLEGLIDTLKRNPVPTPEPGQTGLVLPYTETDERPFYADKEVIPSDEMNVRFAERVDLFHQSIRDSRWERPRIGTCNNRVLIEKHINGEKWSRIQSCGGTVRAVETRINGALRVDGLCTTCGWEIHRAGLLKED
jgi:hypothetical protein